MIKLSTPENEKRQKGAWEIRPAAMRSLMTAEDLLPHKLLNLIKQTAETFHGNLTEATAVWREQAIKEGKEPLRYVALRTAALVGPETLAA